MPKEELEPKHIRTYLVPTLIINIDLENTNEQVESLITNSKELEIMSLESHH